MMLKKVYVGTDYGVAISTDNGDTWSHKMLENTHQYGVMIYSWIDRTLSYPF